MIVDPPPKLNSDESDVLSICYLPSLENQSNEVISNMVLTHLFKRWYENNTWSHPISIAMTSEDHIFLQVLLHYSEILSYPNQFSIKLLYEFVSVFQTDESHPRIIINKDQLYVMEIHMK